MRTTTSRSRSAKNANTLVLTPKSGAQRRFVVQVDPKSNLPQHIALEQNKDGKWVQLRQEKVSLGSALSQSKTKA